MNEYIKREDALIVAEIGGSKEIIKTNLKSISSADVVEVVRCKDCIYWDRGTIKHKSNDFYEWDEAECEQLAYRDGYNEISHYTDADDYCSYGERRKEQEHERRARCQFQVNGE